MSVNEYENLQKLGCPRGRATYYVEFLEILFYYDMGFTLR